MSSIPRRTKQVAKVVATKLAPRVPLSVGPDRWTTFATNVRIDQASRSATADPAAALEALDPLLDQPEVSPRVWLTVAVARERQRDYPAALSAARQAGAVAPASIDTLLLHRRMALRCRQADEAAAVLRTLSRTAPRTKDDLHRTVDALRDGDVELVLSYRSALRKSPRASKLNQERLRELLDEFRVADAHADGPQAYAAERLRVLRERRRPLLVMIRALTRCGAWNDLAEFVATTPGGQQIGARGSREPFPTAEIGAAAAKALAAGWAEAASMLSARALVVAPRKAALQKTFDDARDQIMIARYGWTFPAPGTTPYEPAPDATLAVLSQSLPHRSGGYATRTHGVLTGLSARGRQVEAVTRLGFPYDRWKSADQRVVAASDTVDGIVYHRLLHDGVRKYPQYPLADYVEEFTQGVMERATAHRAGLIHASSFYVAGLAGLTAARRLGLPFIYEMRGLEELMKVSRDPGFVGSERFTFLQQLETGIAREADAVFVITEALRREMAERGVSEERMTVVPNGVHPDRFEPRERDRALEAELGLTGKTVIGYVGGLVDYEGLDVLLEAVAGLKDSRDDVHLLVVGDGAYERVVHEKAHSLRLGDIATFTGRVPHEQVERYLSLVDIAPFPRLPLPVCELISPIKPFESMAMGKAVIVSDVAALTEIVQDGVTGRAFRKGDPDDLRRVLEQLIDSPDERRALGQAARRWVVDERDWASITGIVDDTYRRLLADRVPMVT